MAAEHGGAMGDGGEAWKMRYHGSKDGTTVSTKCWRARWSRWRLIAGHGGGRAANLPAGLRWRSVASLLRAGGGASTGERESGRDGVERSAARSAGVGGRVGADASRLRRTAALTAHGRHGGRALPRSERRAGTGAARAEAGQTRAGLGWAEAKRAALQEARWVGFGRGPRNEAAAREKRKTFFKLCFQEIFKYQFFKYHFEQEDDIF